MSKPAEEAKRKDEREEDDDDKITKVINRPGIPLAFPGTKLASNRHWQIWWWLGVGLLTITYIFVARACHFRGTYPLASDSNLDLQLQGCDISFEHVTGQNEVLVRYWRWFTSSEVVLTDGTFNLTTTSSAKWKSFRCSIAVRVDTTQLKRVKLQLTPDAASTQTLLPTNIKGQVFIAIKGGVAMDSLDITSTVFSQVQILDGARIGELSTDFADGGTVACSLEQAPEKTKINGNRVQFTMRTKDSLAVSVTEHTKKYVVVSGVSASQVTDLSYKLLSDAGSTAALKEVQVLGTSTCTYFEANNGHDITGLQTIRGPMQETVGLMPSGVTALTNIKNWLTAAESKPSRYMIYFQFMGPNAPLGTLRVLSAKAYVAFSLEFFALISAGMMSPTLVWAQLELVGVKEAWPSREAWLDPTNQKQEVEYVKNIWDLTRATLPAEDLASTSTIVYKPVLQGWKNLGGGDHVLLVERSHNKQKAGWNVRPLSFKDRSSFMLAASLTLVLGFTLGLTLCWVFYKFVLPNALIRIRDDCIRDGASFKLTQVLEVCSWTVSSAMIQAPDAGVLLRWKAPAQQMLFAELKVEARRWPLAAGPSCKVKGIDPGRLPMFPGVPGQYCFLFSSNKLQDMRPKSFDTLFDNELYAMAQRFRPTPKALANAKAYQFQVKAFTATGAKLTRSTWSRPTYASHKRPFVEYPLLMFRSMVNLVPKDTWGLFLERTTHVSTSSLLELKFKNVRIAVRSDSPLVLKDAITFGSTEKKAIVLNVVDRSLSLEHKKLEAEVELDAAAQSFEDLKTVWTTVGKKKDRVSPENMDQHQWKVCDCGATTGKIGKEEHMLSIGFSGTITDTVSLELSPIKVLDGVETAGDPFATAQPSWQELFETGVSQKPLILRVGTRPVALILAELEFFNPQMPEMKQEVIQCLENGTIGEDEKKQKKGDSMLDGLVPGYTFLWGESLSVSWDRKGWPIKPLKKLWTGSDKGKATFGFDVYMCAHPMKDQPGYTKKDTETLVASNVQIAPGGQPTLTMLISHGLPANVVRGHGHFELRYHTPKVPETHPDAKPPTTDKEKFWYRSPDFMIIKPVSLQEIEFGYASFCVQNNLPMTKMNTSHLQSLGLTFKNTVMQTASGYRNPLPWEDPSAENAIINYEGCTMIHDQKVLTVNAKPIVDDDWREESPASQPAVKASDIPPGGLSQPLLAAASSGDDAEDPAIPEKIETLRIPTQAVELCLPVNCFWNYKTDWRKEFLLTYQAAPSLVYPNGITGLASQPGKVTKYTCFVLRMFIKMALFFLQGFTLILPATIVLVFWIIHDVIMANVSAGLAKHEYVEDFLISPSVGNWNALDQYGHAVVWFFIGYSLLVLLSIFYCTFLNSEAGRFSRFLDSFTAYTTTLMLFLFITYLGIMAVWCFMGAIVEPEVMLPYAIMMLMLYFIVHSTWSKLSSTMEWVLGKVYGEIDHVLHTLTSVFLEAAGLSPPSMTEQIDMGAANLAQAGIIAGEAEQNTKLAGVANCTSNVDGGQLATAEFRVAAADAKAYPTDFIAVAADYSAMRQGTAAGTLLEACQEAATTAGLATNTLKYTLEGAVIKPAIEVGHIYQGILNKSMAGIAAMGASTPSEDAELGDIADKMQLHPSTAKQMRDAFLHAIAGGVVVPPAIGAGDIQKIRSSQLFDHFVTQEGESHCNVKKFLTEVQEVDMESFDARLASVMTECVDWVAVSRTAGSSSGVIFNQVVPREIAKQLDDTYMGSACWRAARSLFDVGASLDKKIKKDYAIKDEARVFLDAGIVSEEHFAREGCRAILDAAMALKRDLSGGMTDSGIVAAARDLLIPATKSEIYHDDFRKSYLWFDGLVVILKGIGWTEEELDMTWLKGKWETLTEETGLYGYMEASDLQLLVESLTHGHLWKSAVKAVLFECKIHGLAGCTADDSKALLLANNAQDLKALQSKVKWPAWIETIYESIAVVSRHETGPKFMEPLKLGQFLQKIVYDDDVDKDAGEGADCTDPNSLVMLNGLPTNALDLQWRFGDGALQSIYHVIPGKDSAKRIRGLWLEAVLVLFDRTDSVPSDVDYFYAAWDHGVKLREDRLKAGIHCIDGESGIQAMRYTPLKAWIKDVYLVMVETLTNKQFGTIINETLNLGIPVDQLTSVFMACPLVAGDDRMVLRKIPDLGYGLKMWMGCGLWKSGCTHLVQVLMEPGGMRDMALADLDEQFDILDEASSGGTGARGVIQVPQIFYLMKKICHLGLTVTELRDWVSGELGMEIPLGEMQQSFNIMDVNGDGVLSWSEFIPAMRYLLIAFIPKMILERMGLTTGKIVLFVLAVGLNLAAIYLFISLVFAAFTTGEGIASAMHSSMAAGMGAMQKVKSEAGSSGGGSSSVGDYFLALEQKVKETIILTLGLTKEVADRMLAAAEGNL